MSMTPLEVAIKQEFALSVVLKTEVRVVERFPSIPISWAISGSVISTPSAEDHRTGFENGNINAVMDGDIDGFINAYLKMQSQQKLAAQE